MDSSTLLRILEAEQRRRDFWQFCLHYDPAFFSKRPFLQLVAAGFQRIAEGKIKTLQVSLPPRAGKSYITSLYCAWLLGRQPTGSIMRNSVTARLYSKLSYDTRAIILSTRYLQTFPDLRLAPDKQAVEGWNTSQARQVSYFGAGAGGTVIGFGATLVAITDDLYRNLEDALSETIQEKTWDWYTGTHLSRMEKDCPAIDIGTRWSTRDVIGRNVQDGNYQEQIVIPALDGNGNSFCEDVKSTAEYLALKRKLHHTIWNAEYMQQPAEEEGVLFKKSETKRFSLKQLTERLAQRGDNNQPILTTDSRVGFVDVADEGDDALSFPMGYIIGDKVYITDWIFTEDNIDITLPLCAAFIQKHRPDYARVESNGQGSPFHKMLVTASGMGADRLLKVHSKSQKHTRILMAYAVIKEHFHFIQEDELQPGSPYARALDQLFGYMKSGDNKHDDAPDSIAGLAKFLQALMPHVFG